MPRYRITLKLNKNCPPNLNEHKLLMNGAHYNVAIGKDGISLSLSPLDQADREHAARTARQVTNRFLNRLTAFTHYSTRIEPGYGYENIDNSSEKGDVVEAVGIASSRLHPARLPKEVGLDQELTGAAFLRCGDLSDDPFDSFRNYYLAVDRIGKSVRGRRKPDSSVITDTIHIVQHKIVNDLADRLTTIRLPSSVRLSGKVPEDLNNVLYGNLRCALMHSGGSNDFVPFDLDDEETVRSALPIMRGLAWQYVKHEREHLAGNP